MSSWLADRRLTSATDEYQLLAALTSNRRARLRQARLMVEGVVPIEMAARAGTVRQWLVPDHRRRSAWAEAIMAAHPAEVVELAGALFDGLSGRDDPSELLAVVDRPDAALPTPSARMLAVVLDRPSSPRNIGAVVRSCDAFGADAVVVAGHSADPFDPNSVTASRGAVFTVPIASVPSAGALSPWLEDARTRAAAVLVGADEEGAVPLEDAPLEAPIVLVLGNESRGLAHAWRDACDVVTAIPMRGSVTSLNVASAAAVLLYEIDRRRRGPTITCP